MPERRKSIFFIFSIEIDMRLISLKINAGLIEAKIFHDGVSAYFDLKLIDAENFNNLGIVIYPYNPDLLSHVVLLKGEEIVSERRTKQTNLADYGIEIRLYLIPIFRWYEIMNIPEYQLYGIRRFWETKNNFMMIVEFLPILLF